ncbi:MAG: hypothetical protein ACYDG7_00780, partial [Thermoleophilia bacterium]
MCGNALKFAIGSARACVQSLILKARPVASFKNVLERAYRCLTKNVAETVCGFSSFLSSFILLALKVK